MRVRMVSSAIAVALFALWAGTNFQLASSELRPARMATYTDPLFDSGIRCPPGTVHYGRAQTDPGEDGVRGGLVCRKIHH